MLPAFPLSDPPAWFGRLQRAYLASGDEAVLEEAADLGRLMAVTEVAVESVIEVHGAVLADALAAAPRSESARLVAAACTVLAELMVACRLASERVALDSNPAPDIGVIGTTTSPAPEFLRFRRGGVLDDSPGELWHWLDQRVGREISVAAQAAVAQSRIAMFDTTAPAGLDPIRLVVCPFHDGGGIIAIRDVKHLVDARERAFQRRRLESVGQMASGLAHELNNLLQPILSMAQMVQEDCEADAGLAGSMALIVDTTRRAAAIVHGMLLYVRRPRQAPHLICMAKVVPRILETLRHPLPADIRLEIRCDAIAGRVAADADELRQIVQNLLDNASHAMIGHGAVRIRLDEARIDDRMAVRMRVPAGRYARLHVSDHGPGIAPALLDRVFEPFFTTKGIGEGTGLGLSIVQGIVRSWGGSVIARNSPEGGAIFEILLPLVDISDTGDLAIQEANG